MSHNKSSSLLNIALFAAVVGSVGAAVLAHPKGKQIKTHLTEVGDDFVFALDRALDKVSTSNSKDDAPLDVAGMVVSVFDELKNLNGAATDVDSSPLRSTRNNVTKVVDSIEQAVETGEDEIGKTIQWFEKKGKALAKKGFK